MEFVTIVERLVPDVEWIGNVTNDATVETLQSTFYSPSGASFPTNSEGIAAWNEILAERAVAAEAYANMADLEKVNTYLTGQITPMTSLTVEDRTKLRDILLRIVKFLKYGE